MHRMWATSFSNLRETAPPKYFTGGTRPLRPPAFDTHAVKVLRVEKTAKKASESQKGLFWDSLAYLRELEQRTRVALGISTHGD